MCYLIRLTAEGSVLPNSRLPSRRLEIVIISPPNWSFWLESPNKVMEPNKDGPKNVRTGSKDGFVVQGEAPAYYRDSTSPGNRT